MCDTRLDLIVLATMLLVTWGPVGNAQEASRLQTAVVDRAIQPGEAVRLDVICDCEATRATATMFGHDVPLFQIHDTSAWRGLIGIDLDIRPGTYPITIVVNQVEGTVTTTRELTVVAKRFPTRHLRVPAGFVNPPTYAIERIKHESLALQAVFETVTALRQWQGTQAITLSTDLLMGWTAGNRRAVVPDLICHHREVERC